MTRSSNEVQTLVAKAARGAGAPAGQAASFGRAAACHLAAGRTVRDLTDALGALPSGPILSIPLELTRLLEQAQDGVAQGEIASAGQVDLIQSYAQALPFECACNPSDTGVSLTIQTTKPAVRGAVVRLDLAPEFEALLIGLAAKILVPESDASRLAGAGAGLTDND